MRDFPGYTNFCLFFQIVVEIPKSSIKFFFIYINYVSFITIVVKGIEMFESIEMLCRLIFFALVDNKDDAATLIWCSA